MQSILALCALALVGLLVINVKSDGAQTEGGMIRNEVESLALLAAVDKLDWAATLPFDARADVTTAAGLTDSTAFGGRSYAAVADLDDLHRLTRTETVTTSDGALPLGATMAVAYVARTGTTYAFSPNKTFLKRLTVTVEGPGRARVAVSRIYPYRPL